jgi:hypothetical protein
MGIKIYINLPPFIRRTLDNIKEFILLPKSFFYNNPFFTMNEYFNHNATYWWLYEYLWNSFVFYMYFYCNYHILLTVLYVTTYNFFFFFSHNINTRQHLNLHQPAPNLTGFKHGIYCSGVMIYNNLPSYIKQLSDDPRTFERKFKNFLYLHSYYSLEEYCQQQFKS